MHSSGRFRRVSQPRPHARGLLPGASGIGKSCWARDEREAKRTAHEWWPNAAIGGELGQELPLPRHFEQAAENVTEDDVAKVVTCGPEVDRHVEIIRKYIDAGYDHVYVHQIGPDQHGFFRFYEKDVLPQISGSAAAA